MKKLDDRFWAKVDKGAANGCWEWTSNRNNKGYGMFKVSAAVGNRLAHRLSYEHHFGRIPDGGLILHGCDNPACVNPAHLRVGSHKQNVADMDDRGRRVTSPMMGEDNPHSMLTAAEVVRLRQLYVQGAGRKELSAQFGISVLSVDDYTSGRSWRHLLGLDGAPTLVQLQERAAINQKPSAKITASMATEIRHRLAKGETGVALAAAYGVHKATISDIKLRKIWADVG